MELHGCTCAARALALGAGLAAAALGCGGEAERPSGAPMGGAEAPEEGQANRAPVLESLRLEPESPVPGTTIEAVTEARDPDGHAVELSYRWSVERDVVAEGRRPQIAPEGLSRGDRVEVEVVASDGMLESEPRRARVEIANRAPRVRGVDLDAAQPLRPGDVVTALVDARDPDGERLDLEIQWLVNGEEVDAEGKTFDTEGLERGDEVAARVRARDGYDASRSKTSPALTVGNSPPLIGEVPPLEREGDLFRWRFEASDPDGDRSLRFRLAKAPEGMTIDPILGVVRWRPGPDQAGSHTVEVVVEDGAGDASARRFEARVSAEQVGDEGSGSSAPPAAAASEG